MDATTHPPLGITDSGLGIVISGSIVGFLATVTVALRLWARKLTRLPLGADDWLCIAALFFQHAVMIASSVAAVNGGLGRDMSVLALQYPDAVVVLFQSAFAGELGYTYSSPLIKLSVLVFYRRIFPTRAVRLGTLIIGTTCILWCIAITILDFIQCRPLKAFWYIELQALPTTHCINPIQSFLGNSLANSLIDLFTLTLPINEVLKLHTTTRRKINIALVFLLGGVAFAASAVRTVSTGVIIKKGYTNFSKQFVLSLIATVIEIYVAIIGACMPTLVPVYRRLRYGSPSSTRASGGSKEVSASGKNLKYWKQPRKHDGPFERLAEVDDGLVSTTHERPDHGQTGSGRIESYALDSMVPKEHTISPGNNNGVPSTI
ncbi:hypothetical protein F4808DRAFT_68624 [Astrocystis sublimbata]|nr:hypothetical protein F4808DRAFT_68624 [Astrocystis sublimbata]